mmetsp:Transcript_48780/g.156229  ORF Transcript_48780/g.156229 Transcript_48780/m.156229 type:complete len:209 (+) Transcript_48780:154-780(+)
MARKGLLVQGLVGGVWANRLFAHRRHVRAHVLGHARPRVHGRGLHRGAEGPRLRLHRDSNRELEGVCHDLSPHRVLRPAAHEQHLVCLQPHLLHLLVPGQERKGGTLHGGAVEKPGPRERPRAEAGHHPRGVWPVGRPGAHEVRKEVEAPAPRRLPRSQRRDFFYRYAVALAHLLGRRGAIHRAQERQVRPRGVAERGDHSSGVEERR